MKNTFFKELQNKIKKWVISKSTNPLKDSIFGYECFVIVKWIFIKHNNLYILVNVKTRQVKGSQEQRENRIIEIFAEHCVHASAHRPRRTVMFVEMEPNAWSLETRSRAG